LVEHSAIDGLIARGREPVIEASRQWAGVSGAFLVRILASFVTRYEF
jgi:hypothetical protein